MSDSPVEPDADGSAQGHHPRRALGDAQRHLLGRVLKLAAYLLVAYLVLKLVPALEQALRSLEHASWQWVLGSIALEVLSETGFVFAWRAIIDPQNVFGGGGRGRRIDDCIGWAQLGGGLVLPAGSWGGMGLA
jgi:hypothetical protein